jgi:hypothetical protein
VSYNRGVPIEVTDVNVKLVKRILFTKSYIAYFFLDLQLKIFVCNELKFEL